MYFLFGCRGAKRFYFFILSTRFTDHYHTCRAGTIVFLAYIHGAKVHVFRLRHPNHPIILRNSLIIIVRYMMAQKSDEVRSATQTPSNTASRDSRPLGRAGEGLRVAGEGLPTTTLFVPANSRFFYRQRRLFDFAPFQPANGQARRWVVADIRERALGNICQHTQTHRAKP